MPYDKLEFAIIGKDKYSGVMKKLRSSLPSLKTAVTATAGAVTGLSATLFAMAKSTATTYDAVGKFSDRIGISTEALSKYHYAAELSGISTQTMNMAFQRMTRRIAEAAKGTGVATGALTDLGIQVKDIQGRAPDKQFEIFARALDKVKDSGERTRLAMQLFDSEGVAVLQMLKNGSAGLADMRTEAEKYGRVVSEEAAQKSAAFNDSLARMQTALKGLKDRLAVEFMPKFTAVFNEIAKWAVENRVQINKWKESIVKWAERGVIAIGYFADSWRGLKMIWEILKVSFAKFSEYLWRYLNWWVGAFSKVMKTLNFKGIFDNAIVSINKFRINNRDAINEMVQLRVQASQNLKALIGEESYADKAKKFVEFLKNANNEIQVITEKTKVDPGIPGFKQSDYSYSWDTLVNFYAEWEGKSRQMNEVAKTSTIQMADHYVTAFSNMSEAAQSFGSRAVTVHKIFAAAEAIASTYAGAARALKDLPYPFSWIVAGATIARGLAYVANIKGIAHGGLGEVPTEGTYLLSKGEGVLKPSENQAYQRMLKGGGGNIQMTNNWTILPNVTNIAALLAMDERDWKEIIEEKFLPAFRSLKQAGITI